MAVDQMHVRLTAYLMTVVMSFLVLEVLSYLILSLDHPGIRSRTYRPPTITQDELTVYLENRHPVLGWPTTTTLAKHYNKNGARISPANEKIAAAPCLSLYGDSLTYSYGVSDEKAWGNLLAQDLGCRVDNFGVNGYGVDQAVLRFEHNPNDSAPVVILGIFSDDLARSMNQWRSLLNGRVALKFLKPSFSLSENGELEITPVPRIETMENAIDLYKNPSHFLKNEMFMPNSKYGPVEVKFSYLYAFLKLSLNILIRSWDYEYWNGVVPDGMPLYMTNESLIEMNAQIVERIAQTCMTQRRTCYVLMIPSSFEIRYYIKHSVFLTRRISEKFSSRVKVLDATEFLAKNMSETGFCSYLDDFENCGYHYGEDGYELIAKFIKAHLCKGTAFRCE